MKAKGQKRKGAPPPVSGAGAYSRMLAGGVDLDAALVRPQPLAPPRTPPIGRAQVVPRPAREETLPDGLDRKFLPVFVSRAASALPRALWETICRNIGGHALDVVGQASAPVRITIGTACSGSEFYLTALPLLAKEIGARLRRPVLFDHRWSCEIDANKRQWIVDNFAPPRLFADVTKLAQGRCHDFVSGTLASVECVDLLIAGTSCKDASRLNNQHVNRLNVVDTGSHSTGETFKGLTQLVAAFGPRCRLVCLENVASLRDKDPRTGRSNLDGVVDAVRSLGLGFVSKTFSAQDTGLPVARPRLYMAGVRCSCESTAQQVTDSVLSAITARVRPVPLDSLLLTEAEPLIMMSRWMPEGLAREGGHVGDVMYPDWQLKHRAAWANIPPDVQAHVLPRFTGNPWFRTLSPRQRDLLLLASCQDHMARKKALAIPLHSSLGWEKSSQASCLQTLVPKGVYWLVGRQRPLLGVEAVRLQGCDPVSLLGLVPGRHDNHFLHNLAGNAFCVYQFSIWLLAALAAGDLTSCGRL